MNTEELLQERGRTHGDFRENARISQELKAIVRSGANYPNLLPYQVEALDMIAHKIGRTLSGDPTFNDHWDDIGGYSGLGSKKNKEFPL